MEPEDRERMPDGIPHAVVGLSALYAVAVAAMIVLAWTHAWYAGIAFAVA